MYKGKRILGIIPARGGSKGVPRKNIREISGKPLIAWTIEGALRSKYIDQTIVSTDDKEIADVSLKNGAVVPFMRPIELARDGTGMMEVIFHALEYFEKLNDPFDIIVLLQPTSPLRNYRDIDNAVEAIFSKNARAIVSVCETDCPPCWTNILPQNGCMKDFISTKFKNKNRQELPVHYRVNGAVYASYIDDIKKNNSFFGGKTFAYIMPMERSIDIDRIIDFKIAELFLEEQKKHSYSSEHQGK